MKVFTESDWDDVAEALSKGMSHKRVAEIVVQQRKIPNSAKYEVALWTNIIRSDAKKLRKEIRKLDEKKEVGE